MCGIISGAANESRPNNGYCQQLMGKTKDIHITGGTATDADAFAAPADETRPNGNQQQQQQLEQKKKDGYCCFQMPLHYPRYKKGDYETMPEWKLDCLLKEYGLPVFGDVYEKRDFAMGAFLWL